VTKSIPKSSQQTEWQKHFTSIAPVPPTFTGGEHTEESFRHSLWHNVLNHDSLRLTIGGYDWVLKHCKLPAWHIKVDKRMTNQVLLQLDHMMTAPYCLVSRNAIKLIGEQDAIMLQLHAGNLEQFLNNLSI
jgi:hypothetical protein